ncbi:acetaldehyde dehydrogenase (acetylating) [Shewanella sp. NIFS-20-20]|uniref:acetaldehyde dehydrogenase (acetylating) n=1 Tax=Shewanella sp. NIFS-20-20 TaxID=2853806 RepID=UPI001C48F433|nr:acetaldehyde dehydrogenase (acetylating) [Shewanella sp. NIFS-20-20]MBV7315108.1 acetaldehyde dehydrogenase (acetylating) [Shewanella sp. NIFS-20-20]
MANHPQKVKVAIIGSGNIGTDLMIKILTTSQHLDMAVMVGIDPASDGLARAERMGVAITSDGIDGLVAMEQFSEIKIVFDATSAQAHIKHNQVLQQYGKQVIDLTPAAIGPYTVPVVNIDQHLEATNVNMVTCGGQATIPIVAAISRLLPVHYAEIIASVSSRSAGPGTRANIDEFTQTTAKAIQTVGGATEGKAIIVLNPAEPPMIMRDTVFAFAALPEKHQTSIEEIAASIAEMVSAVQAYVPGYRLKQQVQFERYDSPAGLHMPDIGRMPGIKVSVFLEVEGAAHYLPAYAGNLDIMTSAALGTAEQIVQRKFISQ